MELLTRKIKKKKILELVIRFMMSQSVSRFCNSVLELGNDRSHLL